MVNKGGYLSDRSQQEDSENKEQEENYRTKDSQDYCDVWYCRGGGGGVRGGEERGWLGGGDYFYIS